MKDSNFHITKVNRKEKFWYHHIRKINYFSYKYWWLLLGLFILYILLWYFFCFRTPLYRCNQQQLDKNLTSISTHLDSCCSCNKSIVGIPPPICPDRMLVFQVCNSNRAIDDDFDVYLNGVMIGELNLNSNDQVGSLFIASLDKNIAVYEPDFVCPLNKMEVFYFDPGIIRYGENTITMKNVKKNNNNNEGTIEIRNYLLQGNNLISPCKVRNLEYTGRTGAGFTKKFNYTKCCE